MKERLDEIVVAMRAARELKPGDYCNLGLGMPQMCALHIPEGVQVQAENGVIGYGPLVSTDNPDQADAGLIDAGGKFYTAAPGMCFFDMLTSFAMIRSGRLISILGGLQVSENGDLAIHSLSDSDEYPQIGGSMDLAWGAKRVIVTMTHTHKDGTPKLVRSLTYPLSSAKCVDLIVTDLAAIEVTATGLILKEFAPGWSVEEILSLTEAHLSVADDIRVMEL
ncbi:MAG: CoA-transferase subunit beta [Dehalococcoidia bacterium]|jgi:3-oxoacid CoA-transferase B subunit